MRMHSLPLVAALAMTGPAFGITVNMTDFQFRPPIDVNVTSTDESLSFSGSAGLFFGEAEGALLANALRARVAVASSTSFTAYCIELTQGFDFGVRYDYSTVAGATYLDARRADALSRLLTAGRSFVTDSATSAAMQSGIWEIVYETGPSFALTTGSLKVAPADAANQAAFGAVDTFLSQLSSYAADVPINVLTNPNTQDFLVVSSIPEPGTWALLAAGLGVLGLMARRRQAAACLDGPRSTASS